MSLNQIEKAIDVFKTYNCPFELMHTVSTYPMRDEDANLKVISTLRDKFNCDVGYSGHEAGLVISYAAATLGITSLERHITLGREMYGSDQAASIEPMGLRQLVGGVRKIEKAITYYKVLSETNSTSFLELKPVTGRKHQLRKQLALINNPIIGDKKYILSKKETAETLTTEKI